MATAHEASPIAPRAGTRWLPVVQIAASICVLLIGLLLTGLVVWSWSEKGGGAAIALLILLALTLVPYVLILAWLRGKAQRKGLALAATTGWAGLIGAMIGGMTISGDLGGGLVISVPQILLLVGTYRVHAAIRRQTGDRRKLTEDLPRSSYLGLLAFLGWFSLVVGPPGGMHSRISANQASAVSSLRTINTAEVTYASTYDHGFSPSLAALGPPPGDTQPSGSAAGLVDSVLANGLKSAYRFTYSPGPRDRKGNIESYTLVARPLVYGKGGTSSYFTDASGVIRYTGDDRPATAKDPPVAG